MGYIGSRDRVSIDPTKVEAVVKWERSSTMTEIKCFLRLDRYYCRFIDGFLSIAAPLTRLTKKNVKFEWDEDCENSTNEFKPKFTTAPTLTILSSDRGYIMYSVASNLGLGCVLM